ncbi:hypothetical protein IIA94_01980 [Patescibacteria group bacterium]|nr:hypothetical protein [Patescibacteria group bacterium]
MKYFELDKNENKILEDFEAGKLKGVKNRKKETARYQQYAKSTLSKTRNINIRLSHRDLQKIKALATEKGLPYQTLISSLLHQYSNR